MFIQRLIIYAPILTQNNHTLAVFCYSVWGRCLTCVAQIVGVCCEETMMELSRVDIERLEEYGYRLEEFAVIADGVARLRNVDGYCYFYSRTKKSSLL